MKHSTSTIKPFLFLLFNLVTLLTILSNVSTAESVIDMTSLDPDAFKSTINSHDVILVKFYAPWCGHCKRLAPDYEEAAKILASNDPPVALAKVDCTSVNGGKDICGQHDVSGYPTLKIFRNGQATDYDGGRDADSIVKKMRSLAEPPSKELNSFDKLDSLYKQSKDIQVIGIFSSKDDSQYKTFIDTANQNRDHATHVHIFQDQASDKLSAFTSIKNVKVSSIILARPAKYRSKFEPDYIVYDGSDDLKDWVQENSHGLVIARGQQNRDIPKPHIIVYYNVDYEKDPKGTNYWRNRVLKVASKYADKGIKFAISNLNSFAGEVSEYGIDVTKLHREPAPAVVARDADGKKFALEEKFSVDSFTKFVDAFLAGKLEPFLKSEDEPDNEDAGVKVAVGKNFEKLVTKSTKDIFIEFYAPWCGHCKSLAPTWTELGDKLKDEPGVDIVKLDATANDYSDQFTVHGFPTLYWYPKDSKSPVKYEGSRDLEALLKYVAERATDELQGFDRDGNEKKRDEL